MKIDNNPQTTANNFNEFFINTGPFLAAKIPHVSVDHESYLNGSFVDTFFTSPTTPEETIHIVSSLKSSNSEGVDFININVIKAFIDLSASPLSQICDISFSTGIVPDRLKISKVIPIFKSEDNTKFTNYRPISILPCFPKIRERPFIIALWIILLQYTKWSSVWF